MNARIRLASTCLSVFLVAGCAGPFNTTTTAIAAAPSSDTIAIGKSTKADVLATLGSTKSISFDSGYEVWVYKVPVQANYSAGMRELMEHALLGRGVLGNAEYVVLFDPAGVVAKTRIRPPAGSQ